MGVKVYLSAIFQSLLVHPAALILSLLLGSFSVVVSLFSPPRLPPPPKTILITGASSGIGKALAEQYSKQGTTLILLGRNKERLQEVAISCEKKGARVVTIIIDVSQREKLKELIEEAERKYHIDLVIANAGVNRASLEKENGNTEEYIYELYDINITGVLNTIVPLIPLFKAKGQGQIAIVSSLMAYVVATGAYASSKACITHLGRCLRVELAPYNIQVNVVAPPYVPTKMTEKFIHNRSKYLIMEADAFAALTQQQLAENRPIVSPFHVYSLSWLAELIPPALFDVVYRFFLKEKVTKKD